MSEPKDNREPPGGQHFEEAIAQYQLELQTELKRTTSVPSAVFDSSDPMLEARLCAATESILRRLIELDIPEHPEEDGADRLLVGVQPAELHDILATAADAGFDGEIPAFTEGLEREFTVILADTCSRGYGGAARRAAKLLRRDTSAMLHDLDELTRAIAERVSDDDPGRDPDGFDALCHRVAVAILHSVHSAVDDEERG